MSLERPAILGTGIGLILGSLPLLGTDLQTASVATASGIALCLIIALTARQRQAGGSA